MMFDCRYAIVCLALPLSACVLTDRDWNPHVRPGECQVRAVSRHEGVWLKNYDAHGRLISGTRQWGPRFRAWENFQYDARGRPIAITSQEDRPPVDGFCDVEGGCVEPALRAIDRVDLEWDSHGRLRRNRSKREEYINDYGYGGEYIRGNVSDEVTEYDYDEKGRLSMVSKNGFQRKIGSPGVLDPTDFYDDQGRLLRHIITNDSEWLRYETWEYNSDGAPTRMLKVLVSHASKVRPSSREEYETLYLYDDAGRLREIRGVGEPDWTYTYTGKCDEVKNTPIVFSQKNLFRCLGSPHLTLEMCW